MSLNLLGFFRKISQGLGNSSHTKFYIRLLSTTLLRFNRIYKSYHGMNDMFEPLGVIVYDNVSNGS